MCTMQKVRCEISHNRGNYIRREQEASSLGQLFDASTGCIKLNALVPGLSVGTGNSYIRGWQRWAQYCGLRGMTHWVTIGKGGRCGKLLDFIMFEHSVLGSRPPKCTEKIGAVRYYHVIRGLPAFSQSGARYKLLPISLTTRTQIQQKLSYNTDFLTCGDEIFRKGRENFRAKEAWGCVNLGFCFLLRSIGPLGMRKKTRKLELGMENGRSRSLYKSKNGSVKSWTFRNAGGNWLKLIPGKINGKISEFDRLGLCKLRETGLRRRGTSDKVSNKVRL